MNAKSFLAGLVLGLALALVGAHFLSSRYKIETSGPGGLITIRTDTWTGKAWMYRYTEVNGGKVWSWDPMLESK